MVEAGSLGWAYGKRGLSNISVALHPSYRTGGCGSPEGPTIRRSIGEIMSGNSFVPTAELGLPTPFQRLSHTKFRRKETGGRPVGEMSAIYIPMQLNIIGEPIPPPKHYVPYW